MRAAVASPGHPLDDATRSFFESRLGHDFSRVRVHHDGAAAASAEAVNAAAYTLGRDVVFADRRYAPGRAEGRRLLAHELAHVVQQSAPGARPHLARSPGWPAWHQQALASIASVAGPSDGQTADDRWSSLLPYLCGLSPERAASLHSRLRPSAPGMQAGTDDFAVYVKNKFPDHHARLIAILSEVSSGKTPVECKPKEEPKTEEEPRPKEAPKPKPTPAPEPPRYRYDPTDPDPHYKYTGEPEPAPGPETARITAVDEGELRKDWLDVIEFGYPEVVSMNGAKSMVDAVLKRADGRPIQLLIIIDHGDPYANFVEIGNSFIAVEELDLYRPILSRLKGAFAPGGKVVFCNCYVGQNSKLIAGLSEIFGVPVEATTGEYYYTFGYSTGDWMRCQPSGGCEFE